MLSTIFWGRACATMVTVFILKDRLDSSQVSSEFIILLLGDVPRVVCQPFWSHRVTDRHKNGELWFADTVGRRFGSLKLPFNDKKSWVRSAAMFVFWVPASISSTVVEYIPVIVVVDDNISVPLAVCW
ncbi:hypothetical protein ZWY2020_011843 [Hordeum vulgare]|nr:hypothetical protein ZWY2020_011843 [Hordeum vulgare]